MHLLNLARERATTFSKMTISIMTFSITTPSIIYLIATLSMNDIKKTTLSSIPHASSVIMLKALYLVLHFYIVMVSVFWPCTGPKRLG
jgi:hypothetical protein